MVYTAVSANNCSQAKIQCAVIFHRRYIMERDPGDVIDRYTIAVLKGEDVVEYLSEIDRLKLIYPTVFWSARIKEMLEINRLIWRQEALIGRVALSIRKANALRVACRNTINKITGSETKEIKKDHTSAEEYL